MDAEADLTKIHIEVTGNESCSGESLWAKSLGDDLYQVVNTPWYATDPHWGDIVRAVAKSPELKPSILEIVQRSGHKTLRVLFTDQVSDTEEQQVLNHLNSMCANYEKARTRVYAIDVRPEADYGPICDFLWTLEEQGRLEYETGATTEDE
jgi:N-acetylglutamate synthase/N-acetylornithine aminotransferase